MAQTISPPRPSLEDPEPEPVAPSEGRRTVRARDAFVTLIVCLGLWALLFAPVLERAAEGSPLGARRSVALAVLRPFSRAAGALGVDRMAEVVMRAVGRDLDGPPGGELELPEFELPPLPPLPPIDEPAEPAPPSTGTWTPPPSGHETEGRPDSEGGQPGRTDAPAGIRVPTADAKLRVAVVGDSLSQGLGPAIAQWFDPDLSRVLPLGRQSTGLARQDYFNWQAAMRKIEEEFRPDLVFVQLGSNDNQTQVGPDGRRVEIGSAAWVTAYRERVDALLEEATSSGTHVVWVGIPVVRDHQRWTFYRRVNAIYRQAAAVDPLATYVDSWQLFQTRDGGYSAYLRNERGVLQEMRAPDGIHFTPTGYGYLAREAIRAAADAFELPQRTVRFALSGS
jgi:hypothetical protein